MLSQPLKTSVIIGDNLAKIELGTLSASFFYGSTTPVALGLMVEASRSHSLRQTKLIRTPLDKRSAGCTDPCLTTHSTH